MKQNSIHAPWLKGYHWEDLTNLHVELGFLRHRLILTLNDKVARDGVENFETLDALAKVDDLLCDAGSTLEHAKKILFNICYDHSPNPKGSDKN